MHDRRMRVARVAHDVEFDGRDHRIVSEEVRRIVGFVLQLNLLELPIAAVDVSRRHDVRSRSVMEELGTLVAVMDCLGDADPDVDEPKASDQTPHRAVMEHSRKRRMSRVAVFAAALRSCRWTPPNT